MMALFPGDIVGVRRWTRDGIVVDRWRVLEFGYRLDERRGDWYPVVRLEALGGTERIIESMSGLEPDPGEPEEGNS